MLDEHLSVRPLLELEASVLKAFTFEALFVEEGATPYPKEILEEKALIKYYSNWGMPGDTAFVLVHNDIIVGVCWTRIFGIENTGYGFVDEQTPELNIALLPTYRNQGWGSKLIHCTLESNRLKGYIKVSLSCNTRNPAFQLYLRLGFQTYSIKGFSATLIIPLL
ncbi:MAG: GNAT family N-acetyltransferase [Bacteroidota bacterium]